MTTKHTPGPWHVGNTRATSDTIYAEDSYPVANVKTMNRHGADADDNARLIAAAPELLEALEGLMALESRGRIMPVGAEWDAARAAIAKATGV